MQEHQSYQQYIDDLIQKHQQALIKVEGEMEFSQETISTTSKIDEAIKQSQKIVQESLKLLEDSQMPSNFSSAQQVASPKMNDQESIGEYYSIEQQVNQEQNLQHQQETISKQGKLQEREQEEEIEMRLRQLTEESDYIQQQLLNKYQERMHTLGNDTQQTHFSNKVISNEKKRLHEQVQAFEQRTKEIKVQIDQKHEYLSDQLRQKDIKIKDLEKEIIKVNKTKESLLEELELKKSENKMLQNQINSSQNVQSINLIKQKIDDLEKKFQIQNEKQLQEIQMYQKNNRELKEKMVQLYEMCIKQRDVIRRITTNSSDYEAVNQNLESNLLSDPIASQSIQETPESIQLKIKQIQKTKDKKKKEDSLLNIKTNLSPNSKNQKSFEYFEQQLKENQYKIQQIEQKLSEQKNQQEQSRNLKTQEKETEHSNDLPQTKFVSKKRKKNSKSGDKSKLPFTWIKKTSRSFKPNGMKNLQSIYKMKRSNSMPKYLKSKNIK